MPANAKVLSLVTNHVLPEDQQQQHHYYESSGEFDPALADGATPCCFAEQRRLYRSDNLARANDRLSPTDGGGRGWNRLARLASASFGHRFVVFEIRDDQRAQYFA